MRACRTGSWLPNTGSCRVPAPAPPRPVTEGLLGTDPWRSANRAADRAADLGVDAWAGGRGGRVESRPGSCRGKGEVPDSGSTENQEQDLNSRPAPPADPVKTGTQQGKRSPRPPAKDKGQKTQPWRNLRTQGSRWPSTSLTARALGTRQTPDAPSE